MLKKKRRVIRDFRIDEICLVGDSTQGGLRVPIMQRAEPLGESELRRRVQKLLEMLARLLHENSRALAENWPPPTSLHRLIANDGKQSWNLESQSNQFTHATDYRSVNLRGRRYFLTASQAAAIRILHEHCRQNTPDIGQHTLLELIESKAKRLRRVFRKSNAWGELIVTGKTKGTCRLNI